MQSEVAKLSERVDKLTGHIRYLDLRTSDATKNKIFTLSLYRNAETRQIAGLEILKRTAVAAVKRERRAIADQLSAMDQRDLLEDWINKIK